LFYMIKLLIRWLYFLLTNSQSCTVLFCSLFYVGNVDAILHRKYVVHLSTHWEGSFILWRSILELGGWTCPCSWCFFIIDVGPVLSPMPISVLSRFLIVPCACFLWCFCSSGMITVPPPPQCSCNSSFLIPVFCNTGYSNILWETSTWNEGIKFWWFSDYWHLQGFWGIWMHQGLFCFRQHRFIFWHHQCNS
jgi:hypothetical protein